MKAVSELSQHVSIQQACESLGVVRSRWYRSQEPAPTGEKRVYPAPARALQPEERKVVHELLNSQRFQDESPYEVYATLLDEGHYYCSIRTMYRILAENEEVRERRNQLQHPTYSKPELLATAPNQLWSWDITKFRGPSTWLYYYLYVILDVFSRYAVGWLLAEEESADLAKQLIAESCRKQGIQKEQLTLHADRGAAMTAKSVAQLLIDLGVDKTHSRPYTPDDNPFSEAQFKTMKYRPDYPQRFESLEHAHTWARTFFSWYNNHHHHLSLGLLTPASVHFGHAPQILAKRQSVLEQAFRLHPERFVAGQPHPLPLPTSVWINPPQDPHDDLASPLPLLVSADS